MMRRIIQLGLMLVMVGCGGLKIVVDPGLPPVVVTSPSPSPSQTPIASPSPSASPVASPVVTLPEPSPQPSAPPPPSATPGDCQATGGGVWKAIELEIDPISEFGDEVNAAIVKATGCSQPGGRCELVWSDAEYFSRVNKQLRLAGFCTGRDVDQISVARNLGDPFEQFHAYNYGGPTVVWFQPRGAANKGSYRGRSYWVPDGTVEPESEPEPDPGPPPPPLPPAQDPNAVVRASIRASAASIHPGGSVTWTCTSTTWAGKPGRPPDLLNISVPPGSKLTGQHLIQHRGTWEASVTIKPGAPAGLVRCNCAWYQEHEVDTPNLGVEVKP